jgi:hypothetical protein
MNLTRAYDFLQVLCNKKRFSTRNYYFSAHIPFITNYLLQKQKLNHNSCYEQKINMIYFIQANGYVRAMHAKFHEFIMHRKGDVNLFLFFFSTIYPIVYRE